MSEDDLSVVLQPPPSEDDNIVKETIHEYFKRAPDPDPNDEKAMKELSGIILAWIDDLDSPDVEGNTPLMIALKLFHKQKITNIVVAASVRHVNLSLSQVNSDGKNGLQLLLETSNPSLYDFVLNHTPNANKNIIFPNNRSVYEWLYYTSSVDYMSSLSAMLHLLQYKFAVPQRFGNGVTIAEVIIFFVFQLDKHYGLKAQFDNTLTQEMKDRLNLSFGVVLQLAEQILDALFSDCQQNDPDNMTAFCQASNGFSVFHYCMVTGEEYLLEYFIRKIKLVSDEFFATVLEQKDTAIETTAGMIGLLPNQHFRFDLGKVSRGPMLKRLLEEGLKLDTELRDTGYTMLNLATIIDPRMKSQRDCAIELVDALKAAGKGAECFRRTKDISCPFSWVCSSLTVDVLERMVELDEFRPNMKLGSYGSHISTQIVSSARNRMGTNMDQCVSNDPAVVVENTMEVLTMMMDKHGVELEVETFSQLLMFYPNNYVSGCLFKKLLAHNRKGFCDGIRLDLVTHSVVANCLKHFLALCEVGAPLDYICRVRSCEHVPPHRRITHLSVKEKAEVFEENLGGNTRCDICSQLVGNGRVTTCARLQCNMDICERCAYFSTSKGDRKGVSPMEMATRRADAQFIGLLHFLTKTETGTKLHEKGLTRFLYLIRDAKLTETNLLKSLPMDSLFTQLGVYDEQDRRSLRQLVL